MLSAREIDEIVNNGFTAPATRWSSPETTDGWFEFEEAIRSRWNVETQEYGTIQPVVIPELGTVKLIEEVGGEGEGDHMHIVFSLTDADGTERLFRKDGYYSSYGESEYDTDLYEAKPVEKTITEYEAV